MELTICSRSTAFWLPRDRAKSSSKLGAGCGCGGELGYKASLDLGRWQPFVKGTWNHELADADRLVTASLTTIAAPSYSLLAVDLGKDWGTGILGTRYKIGPDASAYAALIGQVGQDRVVDFGGQVGINVAFNPHP